MKYLYLLISLFFSPISFGGIFVSPMNLEFMPGEAIRPAMEGWLLIMRRRNILNGR